VTVSVHVRTFVTAAIGGGHTWPGGAQYLPHRLLGPVARDLDATGIILDTFRTAAAP
jgi:poly(3-hydroxybutyrate) depolymerase